MGQTMLAAYLPGTSRVVLRETAGHEPGHGEVLLRMKASTICGSDGGMSPFLLADEKDLIHLPEELSYADGAQVACGLERSARAS